MLPVLMKFTCATIFTRRKKLLFARFISYKCLEIVLSGIRRETKSVVSSIGRCNTINVADKRRFFDLARLDSLASRLGRRDARSFPSDFLCSSRGFRLTRDLFCTCVKLLKLAPVTAID